MYQRGSPNVEPSQSAHLPDKLAADQPGEPRQSRAETSALIAVTVYHRLKNVSLKMVAVAASPCGSLPLRSPFLSPFLLFRRRQQGYLPHIKGRSYATDT